jgi:hypothetical protein
MTAVDKKELKYKRYSFKNGTGTAEHPKREELDDDIDRCKKCGCTIDEHHLDPQWDGGKEARRRGSHQAVARELRRSTHGISTIVPL